VHKKLSEYLTKFKLYTIYTEEEIAHYMLPRESVLYSYVVEDEDKQITDFISFYSLPSSILEHPDYETLHCAYLYYYFTGKYDITELQRNVLVIANKMKYDVFNALDIFENR
jgi:glycylpeptide N-tetradecanoyltransferase